MLLAALLAMVPPERNAGRDGTYRTKRQRRDKGYAPVSEGSPYMAR